MPRAKILSFINYKGGVANRYLLHTGLLSQIRKVIPAVVGVPEIVRARTGEGGFLASIFAPRNEDPPFLR